MRKLVVFTTIAVLLAVSMYFGLSLPKPAKAEPVDTYHSSWHLVRETADEDGASFAAVYDLTGVGATTGNFASKDSSTVANGGPFHIIANQGGIGNPYSPGSKWMFTFCGENYNNVDDTFSFNLVGWSRTDGMLQTIAVGDCVLGTQAVVTYPDSGDALGALISETAVTYTHATKKFTDTGDTGAFTGAVVGMLARVTGTGYTDAISQITTVTDANNIICSGLTSTGNGTDSTLQINPAFWADTINLDDQTRWSGSLADPNTATGYYQMSGTLAVINSGNNEVAGLVVDLTGMEWVQFVIYDADAATGEQAGNVTVYGRRF